jgi:hypothetical protein
MNTEEQISNLLKPSFFLGSVYATPGFVEACGSMDVVETRSIELISRHAAGDWGDVCTEDAVQNFNAAKSKGMILSAYTIAASAGRTVKVWVQTDPGHKTTTILLPSEH